MSTDIRSLAVVDDSGAVVAAEHSGAEPEAASAIVSLWDAAGLQAERFSDAGLEHVVVPVSGGLVAMVSAHGHRVAAVTGPRPAVALLLFDLRTCLGDAFAGEVGAE